MRKALAFLTPFGGATVPSPTALNWFPLVGAAIGLAVGAVWWLATQAWPRPAAAAVVLVADVVFTGYLHLDGLADAADGLLPPLPRERRLEAMADPAVGAFGVVTVVVVLALRFGSLASTAAAPLVVGALWCGSRTAMAVVPRLVNYARPGGIASAFLDQRADAPGRPVGGGPEGDLDGVTRPRLGRRPATAAVPAIVGVVLVLVLAIAGKGGAGVAAVGAELAAFALVVALARRRIGGFTGDVLGAAGVVGETVGLLTLAARW
jgi:adenosylcobinamide-GDP ribazoletransferase